jgi:hypothetical protein
MELETIIPKKEWFSLKECAELKGIKYKTFLNVPFFNQTEANLMDTLVVESLSCVTQFYYGSLRQMNTC